LPFLSVASKFRNGACEKYSFIYKTAKGGLFPEVKGIEKQRTCPIASMFALSRRRNAAEVVVKPKISSSRDAYIIFHSLMGELSNEEFWMLLQNRANEIIKTVKVSEEGLVVPENNSAIFSA
jgi:DNA repair protein RadC